MKTKRETNGGATVAARALLLSVALLSGAVFAAGQENQVAQQQTQIIQPGLGGDPIRQLNLTAEQAGKIRAIREQNKDERFAINQRLRQAQRAIDNAIEADNPSEALIEQKARELAEAQVAATRMRALTELQIRRVLTPEQLAKLRALRQQVLDLREQRRNQEQLPLRQRLQRKQDGNQRNGIIRRNPRPPGQQGAPPPGQRP